MNNPATNPATTYDEWFVPALFAPLARVVLDQTVVPPGARILDVACGTGIVARTIARHLGPDGSVTGLDVSPAMLDVARRTAAAEGLDVAWYEGSALDLPFADSAFDLVLCQMGMQFFPDRPCAVEEMYRVLAPGGRVVISTWRGLDQNPFYAALARSVRLRFASPALETPFSVGDPAEIAGLLLETGFGDVSVEPVTIAADFARPEQFVELQVAASAAAIPALQGLTTTEREALIAAIREDMAEPVRAATQDDRLRFPMEGIVARGKRGGQVLASPADGWSEIDSAC
jgi:SAM-dependent methyltransferase